MVYYWCDRDKDAAIERATENERERQRKGEFDRYIEIER
jgi:hypothetical protein